MSLLKVRNIETYYGPIMAIKGVSFDVQDGAFYSEFGVLVPSYFISHISPSLRSPSHPTSLATPRNLTPLAAPKVTASGENGGEATRRPAPRRGRLGVGI